MQKKTHRRYPTYSDDIYTETIGEEDLSAEGGPIEGDPGSIQSRAQLGGASGLGGAAEATQQKPQVFTDTRSARLARATPKFRDVSEKFNLFSAFDFSFSEMGRSLRSPRLIFISIFVVIGAMIAWAQVQRATGTEQFVVSTQLTPPSNLDVVELYVPNFMTDVGPRDVFTSFVSNLEESVKQNAFVDESGGVSDLAVQVRRSAENDPTAVTVKAKSNDPSNTELWLQRYIDYVADQTVQSIVTDVDKKVQAEIDSLRDKIETQTEITAREAEEKLNRYRTALSIAQENGIMVPVDSNLVPRGQRLSNDPLYLQGYWSLEKSLQELRGQIDGNSALFAQDKQRIEELSNIRVDRDKVDVARSEEIAIEQFTSDGGVLLYVIIGAFIGLMVGRFIASKITALQPI